MRDNNHIDTRILRTYELLTEAFLALAETKDIDSIRISEICDSAMIHRATFYNHFNDKGDFVNFVLESSLKKIYDKSLRESKTDDTRSLAAILLLNLVSFAEQHKRMVLNTTSGSGSDTYLHDKLHAFFLDVLGSMLIPDIPDIGNRDEFKSAFCHFIAGGSMSLIRWWLSGGYEYSTKEQLVERIRTVVRTLLAADGSSLQPPEKHF